MKHIATILTIALSSTVDVSAQTAPHSDYLGTGHMEGVTVTTSGTEFFGEGVNTINGSGMDQQYRDAARFLGQSTTGTNYEYIEDLASISFDTWIDDQMAMPSMSYLDSTKMVWDHFVQAYYDQWGEIVINGNEDISHMLITGEWLGGITLCKVTIFFVKRWH